MAQNTLVTITYTVNPSKRQELEGILRGIVERINAAQQSVRCTAYCEEDDPNTFVEVYECDSDEAYDALEDSLDEETSQNIRRIATDFAQARQAVVTLRRVA